MRLNCCVVAASSFSVNASDTARLSPLIGLQDVVQLILQVRVPIERLVVLAEFEVVGRDIGKVVTTGADAFYTGAVERVEQIEPGQVLAHIALRQPRAVQFEQRAGHAAVRILVQRRRLNGPDTAQGFEQRRGESRLGRYSRSPWPSVRTIAQKKTDRFPLQRLAERTVGSDTR